MGQPSKLGSVLMTSQQVSNWKEGIGTAYEPGVSCNDRPTSIQLEGGAWVSFYDKPKSIQLEGMACYSLGERDSMHIK